MISEIEFKQFLNRCYTNLGTINWPIIHEIMRENMYLEKYLSTQYKPTKGTIFEYICKYIFLKTYPTVYMYKEAPDSIKIELALPKRDKGIDIIAITKHNEYIAIQCKWLQNPHNILRDETCEKFIQDTKKDRKIHKLHTKIKFDPLFAAKKHFSKIILMTNCYNTNENYHEKINWYTASNLFKDINADFLTRTLEEIVNIPTIFSINNLQYFEEKELFYESYKAITLDEKISAISEFVEKNNYVPINDIEFKKINVATSLKKLLNKINNDQCDLYIKFQKNEIIKKHMDLYIIKKKKYIKQICFAHIFKEPDLCKNLNVKQIKKKNINIKFISFAHLFKEPKERKQKIKKIKQINTKIISFAHIFKDPKQKIKNKKVKQTNTKFISFAHLFAEPKEWKQKFKKTKQINTKFFFFAHLFKEPKKISNSIKYTNDKQIRFAHIFNEAAKINNKDDNFIYFAHIFQNKLNPKKHIKNNPKPIKHKKDKQIRFSHIFDETHTQKKYKKCQVIPFSETFVRKPGQKVVINLTGDAPIRYVHNF